MPRTRVKFCGITRPADGVAAAEAGADSIGLIFFEKSVRCISVPQAREVLSELPPMVTPVGLFVDLPASEILRMTRLLNLGTVQLHGRIDDLASLKELTVIHAVKSTAATLASLHQYKETANVLLDTPGTAEHGGTGITNDWASIASLVRTASKLPRLIAAGGLTPENVGNVVRMIRPWAVDVSTGIEESPGIKSAEKMRRFSEQVRRADVG